MRKMTMKFKDDEITAVESDKKLDRWCVGKLRHVTRGRVALELVSRASSTDQDYLASRYNTQRLLDRGIHCEFLQHSFFFMLSRDEQKMLALRAVETEFAG